MDDGINSRDAVGLADFLTDRARRASDGRLVLDGAAGLVGFAVSVIVRPPGWIVLCAVGLCFVSFGSWGIADRELQERGSKASLLVRGPLRALRVLALLLGTLGALAAIYGAVALTLGTWIS